VSTRICVPIVERTLSACRDALSAASEKADIIELRLDYLDDLDERNPSSQIESLIAAANGPLILTFRPSEQGGARQINRETRVQLWANLCSLFKSRPSLLCDLEWDIIAEIPAEIIKPDQRIASYHNFNDSVARESEIFRFLLNQPAKLIKIAVAGNEITDCIRVKQMIEQSTSDGRQMIGIVMDEPGIISRVLGPGWGSYLTFASIASSKASASGQLTVDTLNRLYRIGNISDRTIVTGLIGNPVSQSMSPSMHNAAFAGRNIDGVYIPMLVGDLKEFIKRMIHPVSRELDWNLRGLSVTIPHKVNIIPLLDELTDTAKSVGAVNTVIVDGSKLVGDNTDVRGFLAPLDKTLDLKNARASVLGTGGAARAVVYGLVKAGAEVTVFGRRREMAAMLASEFGTRTADWNSLGGDSFDLVVNATSTGMVGDKSDDAVFEKTVTNCRLFYDLVYNPIETRLMRTASAAGVKVIGGLGMLVSQGAEQFRIWTGNDAPHEIMMEAALNKLRASDRVD